MDRCAVCHKPECAYPARERDDGKALFEFSEGTMVLTKSQIESLKHDHAYDERHGRLGTRPMDQTPISVPPPPKRDWWLTLGYWLLLAMMLAMAWYGFGCGAAGPLSPEAIERARIAMRIAQCVEEALPPADSNAAKPKPGSSSPAAAVPSVADAGAADSGIPHGIDTADPWWETDGGQR